jgi:hypothetical protein
MSKNYLLDLFTPHTWDQFLKHGASVSGFTHRQRKLAKERGKPGTIFLCYLVRLSRWCGTLEITSESFIDDTPIYYESDDPFVVRFKVKPLPGARAWQRLAADARPEDGSLPLGISAQIRERAWAP